MEANYMQAIPKGRLINCLDHGFIRLVDYMGSDLSVSQSARISYNAEWRAGQDEKSDAKLINFLWKHHHTTPFEAVVFTFEVKAPILVFRQWHRHRTQSYNEVSARYTELPEEYYVPKLEHITPQSKSNKQGREAEGFTDEQKELFRKEIIQQSKSAFESYKYMCARGLSRELARMVLPVNTYSHMFCTMNLLNLFRFLQRRHDSHAQYEIRVYAEAMLELIKPIVPVSAKAWEEMKEV